ncbi:MAG: lipoprotein insertase outer membrane protein LolB [Pseudomonadota bacterium]
MRHSIFLAVLAFFSMLMGCSHRERVVHVVSWPEHLQHRAQLDNWRVGGHYQVSHLDQQSSGRFAWRQHEQEGQLILMNPLGVTEARLNHGPRHALLHLRSGQNFESDNAERLLNQILDLPVPIAYLSYWLKGIPRTHEPYLIIQRHPNGLPAVLEQAGWRIELLAYAPNGLPVEIHLYRDTTAIDLHLSQWNLQPHAMRTITQLTVPRKTQPLPVHIRSAPRRLS